MSVIYHLNPLLKIDGIVKAYLDSYATLEQAIAAIEKILKQAKA